MAIGSIGSGTVPTALSTTFDSKRGSAKAAPAEKSIADHVAEVDDLAPIRSVSTTRGTLVDTYL